MTTIVQGLLFLGLFVLTIALMLANAWLSVSLYRGFDRRRRTGIRGPRAVFMLVGAVSLSLVVAPLIGVVAAVLVAAANPWNNETWEWVIVGVFGAVVFAGLAVPPIVGLRMWTTMGSD